MNKKIKIKKRLTLEGQITKMELQKVYCIRIGDFDVRQTGEWWKKYLAIYKHKQNELRN